MNEELKELKLGELKKLIKKSCMVETSKNGLKITIESHGTTKSMNGKSYINWALIAQKDNRVIVVSISGNRMYDIKKAYSDLTHKITAGHWHNLKK